MSKPPAMVLIAARDLRASPAKFLFVILAVAVGVGALTGVRSFSRAFHNLLLSQARTLMAADVSLRVFEQPTPAQNATLGDLEKRGIRETAITETLTMANTASTPDPVLVSVKAVDPAVYPFYGAVKLDPPASLRAVLDSRSAAVSDDLLIRLKARLSDDVRLGGQEFRIAALLVSEPDRMTGSINVGPRIMISREGLDRTGLISLGSRAAQRYLFLLPPQGPTVDQVRNTLKQAFPEGMIADFRETHPIITRGLDRATTFLSLISLIALIVGALGVATAMHAHLQQKMDTIAILKCLGGRSWQVARIYLVQTLALGLAGGLAGIAFGTLVQRAFPLLIGRFFSVQPHMGLDLVPAAQGLAIGILTTLLFTLPALLGIREIRPAVIFRREMTEARPDWLKRWTRSRQALATAAAILAGIGLIAAWLGGNTLHDALRIGAYFAGGLLVSLLFIAGVAWLLLRGLRALVRGSGRVLPAVLRQGVANLYRPGNHAQTVLVTLGTGVMFTLTVYLVQHAVLTEMMQSAPPGMPNVFMLDVPGPQRQVLIDLVKQQKGIETAPEVLSSVAVRLVSIDGVPVEKLNLRQFGRRFLRTRPVTTAPERPRETQILSGAWWEGRPATPQVCAAEEAARILHLRAGMTLVWSAWGRTIESRLACIQRTDSVRMFARFEFIFSPGSLDGFPAIYYGSVRIKPRDVAAMQRAVYEKMPTITVINMADVLEIVQQVVDQIALVVRFMSAFTIVAGAIILASSVAGTRFRRVREVVILKTLGATRRRVAGIFSMEFLVLGAAAGLLGSALATGFAAVVVKQLMKAEFHFDPAADLYSIALTALVAVAAGWLASYRILGQKPLEVLRDE
ncbi:MAG TPA: FtsX-like permease family protein [Bryobacteraceae bacterium]|nr:FtsX-like permease family protein [Bryobacteraceae bacterium]